MPQETPNFTDAAVFKHSTSGFTPASGNAAVYIKSDNKLYIKDSSGTEVAAGGVTSGSVDNAVLRADGTGGSTSQSSDILIDDAVVPFNITGVASTDVITAVGHNFTSNQGVRFPTLTGGSGLTAATTNYFVRDISGDTFKVSATSGGAAVDFTTNITVGTVIAMQASVAVRNNSSETNSALVLSPKGTGAISLHRADGTTTGGNPRGAYAVDLQMERNAATCVASGLNAFIAGGKNNIASGNTSFVCGDSSTASGAISFAVGLTATASGGSAIAMGLGATASANDAVAIGRGATASQQPTFCFASFSTASAAGSVCLGHQVLSNRQSQISHANGQFATAGDAQSARFTLRCKTTTNAAVEMALDGGTTYLTIPSGKVIYGEIRIVGSKSDGSAVACYTRQYAAKNVAGTSTEVFAAVTIGTDNAAGTSLEIATVDAGDYIRIRPTGIASETWRWVAVVDAVEVGYGT